MNEITMRATTSRETFDFDPECGHETGALGMSNGKGYLVPFTKSMSGLIQSPLKGLSCSVTPNYTPL